jgi:hypothetical protein
MINLHNKPALLTAIIIRDLDKANRIRRMQRLPHVHYDELEVERLSAICRGLLCAKDWIKKLVTEQALNVRT